MPNIPHAKWVSMVYYDEIDRCWSNGTRVERVRTAIRRKIRAPRVAPFTVTRGSDTDLSGAYHFLLVTYSNYGPFSYRFRNVRRFQLNFFFIYSMCLTSSLRVLPSKFYNAGWPKKTRMMTRPEAEKRFTILWCLRVLMFNQRVYSSRSTPRTDTTRCRLQSQLDIY